MAIYLPDARFEMPELLIPGRKPVGNVVVDWEHPLARGLVNFMPLQGYGLEILHGAHDGSLISNRSNRMVPIGTDYTFKGGKLSMNQSGVDTKLESENDIGATIDISAQDHTFCVSAFNISWTSQGSSLNCLMALSSVSKGSVIIGYDSALAPWILSGGTSLQATGESIEGVTVFSVKDGVGTLYLNGVPYGTTVSVGGQDPTVGGKVYIAGYDGTSRDAKADFDWCSIYQRALSAEEIKSLYRNPYQFLIPA